MKRLIIILICLFLVSCQRAEQDYFSQPRILYVTLECGDRAVTGRLEAEGERTTFYPDKPEGLEITVTEDGGAVSYKGLVFENSTVAMTYVSALHRALYGAKITCGDKGYPDKFTLENITVTVHKEQE